MIKSAYQSQKPAVFVLPTYINGLAVIRSLGKKGIYVIAGNTGKNNFLGRASRYSAESVIYPDPRHEPEAFAEFMRDFAEKHPGTVVFPTRDDEAEHLSFLHKELSQKIRLVLADEETVHLCLEKQRTYQLAGELDIPHPKTVHVPVGSSVPDKLEEFLLPCLLKPVRNCEFFMRFGRRKAFVCNSHDEIRSRLSDSLAEGFDMMIQELVPGADDTLWEYIWSNGPDGKLLSEFCCHKLAQNPPDLGVGMHSQV